MKIIPAIILIVIALTGCPSAVVQVSDRDIAGQYDGAWILTATRTSPIQRIGTWRVDCRHNPFRYRMDFEGGAAKISDTQTVYINSSGEFHFEIPTESDINVKPSSQDQVARKNITIIYKGQLNAIAGSGSGTMTAGVEELNNRGCTTEFDVQKIQL